MVNSRSLRGQPDLIYRQDEDETEDGFGHCLALLRSRLALLGRRARSYFGSGQLAKYPHFTSNPIAGVSRNPDKRTLAARWNLTSTRNPLFGH